MEHYDPPLVENEVFMNFGDAIQRNAGEMGSKPAVIFGDLVVPWAKFGAMVAQVAGQLRAEGIGRGAKVASLAENTVEHIVLYSAVVSAGACIVPLPYSATAQALTRMMEDSGATLLFASPTQKETAQGLGAETVVDLSELMDWAVGAEPAEPVKVQPEDLFNIIYSSGTTGLPKGILHDHPVWFNGKRQAGHFDPDLFQHNAFRAATQSFPGWYVDRYGQIQHAGVSEAKPTPAPDACGAGSGAIHAAYVGTPFC